MKRFIYLDTNELNSYIAQIYNGLTTTIENQKEKSNEKNSEIGAEIKAEGNVGAGIKGLLNLEGNIGASLNSTLNESNAQAIKDIETKVIHDEAFDKLDSYLEEKDLIVKDNLKVGDFIKHSSSFEVFDLNFFCDWFVKDGFIDFLKKENEKNLRKVAEEQIVTLPSLQQKNVKNSPQAVEKIIKDGMKDFSKKYDYIQDVVNALKSLLPYEKIIMSDSFFIATSDEFFRDKPEMIGFKYGGNISFLGYITNEVLYNGDNKIPSEIPLSGIKNMANNVILNVLSKNKAIYIVHPIAIYYE